VPDQRLIWRIIQIVGLVFLIVGMLEAVSTWFPSNFGEPEWELGTTSYFFDTVPLAGLGLALLLGSAVALGRKWQLRFWAVLCLLLAVFMLLALILYATVLPLAFTVVHNPVALTTIKKAALKTGVQALFYPFALLWLAGAGWKASIPRRRG
jgi:hypothetical protein